MSLKQQFYLREKHMLKTIQYYDNKGYRLAVQLGDTHLRTVKTKLLGDESPIYKYYNNREDCVIIRSKTKEVE